MLPVISLGVGENSDPVSLEMSWMCCRYALPPAEMPLAVTSMQYKVEIRISVQLIESTRAFLTELMLCPSALASPGSTEGALVQQ